MSLRTRRALVVAPVLLALSAGTMVAANADDAAPTGSSAAAENRKGKGAWFKLLSKHHGYPYVARFNPCSKIRYKINTRGAPRKAVRDTKKAFRRLSAISGLKFKYTGRTKILPRPRGSKKYPGRTKIVVAWTKPRKRKQLKGRAGYGGSFWKVVRKNGKRHGRIYKGYALLNKNIKYPAGFGKGPKRGHGTRGQLLMHELGHVVGLWHVNRKRQIMYPYTTRKKARWGKGDRRGLKRVGRPAGCLGGARAVPGATPQRLDTHDEQDLIKNHAAGHGRHVGHGH